MPRFSGAFILVDELQLESGTQILPLAKDAVSWVRRQGHAQEFTLSMAAGVH